jgi:hypothetical protein
LFFSLFLYSVGVSAQKVALKNNVTIVTTASPLAMQI